MDFDFATAIGAVRRQVGHVEHEGRAGLAVHVDRTYDASIEDVWNALTDAERIPRWFLPVSGELRLGGRYQLEGNAGGTITACEPPAHLAVTWEFDGDVGWVDVRLTAAPGGRTALRLEHVVEDGDARWGEFGPGAVGVGWDLTILVLADHLATGRTVAGEWEARPAGAEFMRRSSEEWCRASIAAGTSEDVARLAAARTTAAYTGTDAPPPES